MTQPEPAPASSDAGAVIAVAAIGLALVAIEARVRQDVEEAIAAASAAIGAALVAALASGPVLLGISLFSTITVHRALTGSLATARDKVSRLTASGYDAAAHLALMQARRYFADDDLDLPELPGTPDVLAADVATMFRHAEADIVNTIRAAYDGVQGDDADQVRPIVISQALDAAIARLQQRAAATAGTAVHRAAADAQQAIWLQQQMKQNTIFRKRWTVTSATPCGMCLALHGTTLALDAEFDHTATVRPRDWRPVWRGLQGPPRHPHCRCQLELVTGGTP